MAYDALLTKIGDLLVGFLRPTSTSASSSVQVRSDLSSLSRKVREDLEALERMLRRIQAVLNDAEKREIYEQSVKLWLRELSDLAYEADDVLDEYNYELLRAQVEADMEADEGSHRRERKHEQELSFLKQLKIEKISTAGSKFSDFPALEELDFVCMYSWTSWVTPVEMGDFPRLRRLKIDECEELETMVPLYLLPALQQLQISRCSKLTSIQLKSGPSSTPSSSSSASSLGPPPLEKMDITYCPLARFSPEDEPDLLPPTLRWLQIWWSPLLVEWCRRDGGSRVAHIPHVLVFDDFSDINLW